MNGFHDIIPEDSSNYNPPNLWIIVETAKEKNLSLNIKQNPWTLGKQSLKMASKQTLHLGKKRKSGFSWTNLAPEVSILTIFIKL